MILSSKKCFLCIIQNVIGFLIITLTKSNPTGALLIDYPLSIGTSLVVTCTNKDARYGDKYFYRSSSLKSSSSDSSQKGSSIKNKISKDERNLGGRRKRIRHITIHNPNPYNIPRDPEERWEFFYTHLLEYYLQHGHTNNIQVGPKINQSLLHNWMAAQRLSYMKRMGIISTQNYQYNKITSLSEEKKTKLDILHFPWGPISNDGMNRHALSTNAISVNKTNRRNTGLSCNENSENNPTKWTFMFHQLSKFYEEHNHSHLPQIYPENPALGKWVYKQRYLKHSLSDRRKQMMDQLQFHWFSKSYITENKKKQTKRKTWNEYYSDLMQFRQENGHCNVSKNMKDENNSKLYKWILNQRLSYKKWINGEKSFMNKDRFDLLEKIGFQWE